LKKRDKEDGREWGTEFQIIVHNIGQEEIIRGGTEEKTGPRHHIEVKTGGVEIAGGTPGKHC